MLNLNNETIILSAPCSVRLVNSIQSNAAAKLNIPNMFLFIMYHHMHIAQPSWPIHRTHVSTQQCQLHTGAVLPMYPDSALNCVTCQNQNHSMAGWLAGCLDLNSGIGYTTYIIGGGGGGGGGCDDIAQYIYLSLFNTGRVL